MLVPINEQSNRSDYILPAGVNLRECNVVIIGSTCQICGRDFKCKTDVAMHMQWRHQQLESVLNGAFNLGSDHHTENTVAEMQKCDVCNVHLMDEHDAADLKSYKRQINKKQIHERRRARKLRLIIKIAGVTMTEIRMSRKYLKVHSNEYFADVGTQTESHENEKRQDDYGMNIDLSLADRVVGNSRVQCVQPHKATNRYIQGKLASVQGDAIACSTRAPATRPIETSNMPNEDATIDTTTDTTVDANSPCASPILSGYSRKVAFSRAYTASSFASRLEDTIDVSDETRDSPRNSPRNSPRRRFEGKKGNASSFAGRLVDTIDVPDEAKDSPRRRYEGEKGNTSPAPEDTSNLENRNSSRRNDSARDDLEELIVYQRVRATGTTATATTSTATPNSWCNKNRHHPVRSNKTASNIDKSMNPPAEPIEIIIDNESDDNCDENMAKCSSASSTQFDRDKGLAMAEPVVDDDVQEILRITRGKVQSDINHESPNRTEREMLVRNALGQMYVSSTQPEIIYPEEEDDTILVVSNNNVDSRDYPPCVAIVDDNCPFPANVATFMYKYNDKLGICLNKLRDYSIGYYNDLPEINNNG